MINALETVLAGLQKASFKTAQAAENIADPARFDPAQDIVDLKSAEIEFKANARVIGIVEEQSEELFRIFDQKV